MLLLGSIIKSGLCCSPFFTILRMLCVLLLGLAFMVTLSGVWPRLSSDIPLPCPSLQLLWEVPKPDRKLGSSSVFKSDLCWILMVGHWQRSFTWKLEFRVIRIAGSHVVMHLAVPPILWRKGAVGDSILCEAWYTVLILNSVEKHCFQLVLYLIWSPFSAYMPSSITA